MSTHANDTLTKADCQLQLQSTLEPLLDAGFISRDCYTKIYSDLERFYALLRETPTNPEDYWVAFQKEFDFIQPGLDAIKVPMNAANLCPEPRPLLRAANELRFELNRNVAQQTRMRGGLRARQFDEARAALARSVRIAVPKNLAIVRNASEANNAINGGYRKWSAPGSRRDNVILWDQNHPTNLAAWELRGGRKIIPGQPAPDPVGHVFDIHMVVLPANVTPDQVAQHFIRHINESTRFISFSETSNGNGVRIPEVAIQAIWNHVSSDPRYSNCHIHIDGTMAFGARQLDFSRPFCHSFVSSCHKWFLGPKETGILYIDPAKAINFEPNIFAYDYKIDILNWNDLPKTAERFELLGQRDDVNIITLLWTELMWHNIGYSRAYSRVTELTRKLMIDLKECKWDVETPANAAMSLGVVWVKVPRGTQTIKLSDELYANGIAASFSPTTNRTDETRIRFCPHIYNTFADIHHAVDIMNQWRGPVPYSGSQSE
ncbi:aminotransferase class V-fold PLP-dependent enzyme [Undibacterium sp. TC4M20W]|uniref:aminotransferase class V-fold PLP-dependent enzyme n=1 Tax=Undibacterium sp. TC4M20W TaxID=3413052 RepID=UPI003BF30C5E